MSNYFLFWPAKVGNLHDYGHDGGAGFGDDEAVAPQLPQGGEGGAKNGRVDLVGCGAPVADDTEVPQRFGSLLWIILLEFGT